jgi:pimeloyl-ACP methyl ester carboxylesterase
VLRYDMYGRGYSDRPDVDYTLDLLDRQLVGLLDSLRLRDPIDLVGLSMGGAVVANFANQRAARLRTLTFVDPVWGSGGRSAPLLLRVPGLGAYVFQTTAVPFMADGQASDFVHPERFPDWADRYRTQMRFRGFGRAMRSTTLANTKLDIDSMYRRTGQLTVPTLLLWGSEDKTVPFALSDSVRRDIPRAEFHAIAGAGHLPGLEKPAETHGLLVQFLRAH